MISNIIKLEDVGLLDFCGPNNLYLNILKDKFPQYEIRLRKNDLIYNSKTLKIDIFGDIVFKMLSELKKNDVISQDDVVAICDNVYSDEQIFSDKRGSPIKAKSKNQSAIVHSILDHDLSFIVGPAGTGKTFISIVMALRLLKNKFVKKIILSRPAVEAGETLGFLPGDLKEKLDPYLQPLYDGLRQLLTKDKLIRYFNENIIEILPLGYMRGRTLNNAFVILDEGQNVTKSQMKMFLTRMGVGSKFVVNGDITQIDLKNHKDSALINTLSALKDVDGINMVHLDERDNVRHKLVSKIINKL